MMKESDIKDISLASKGKERIEWTMQQMPVLCKIKERFKKERPLEGVRIACCLHVTSETAVLMLTLKEGGADIRLCASNPLSTQDDVAAALVKEWGISVFAKRGEDRDTYYEHIKSALSFKPHITMDDGADLVCTLHESGDCEGVWAGTEETTTGVQRLYAMQEEGKLRYPIIAVNNANTKYLFDNRYGTGQSTIDGIIRATGVLISGKNFVVCGYGWCGRGVATKARGLGAKVIVCEVDPIKALEATMDGFWVMPMDEASKIGDIFVTTTGNISVIREEHFLNMKDGVLLCNAGHFNVEIDIDALKKIASSVRRVKDEIEEYKIGGRRIYLLAEGRLVNLACAEGHPADVMDMSFSNQALCTKYIRENKENLEKKVYNVPPHIDAEIAHLKLESMGIKIDKLTQKQRHYLKEWRMGT